MQSALGVPIPGHEWAEPLEDPQEWRKEVGAVPGAWGLLVAAVCAEERGRWPWLGVGAGAPS